MLKGPLGFSREAGQGLLDLAGFKKNADELRLLKASVANQKINDTQVQEMLLENERLTQLLGLRRILPGGADRVLYARVIGRAPSAWNRVLLIDKGEREGVRMNQAVITSDQSLIGKIVEVGPAASKVLLVSDPNSRVSVLIQRTRQQGILYGTVTGECRVKYLSVDVKIQPGDKVESAGLGSFFPKRLLVGEVVRSWKEPGQIYQVAEVRLSADLNRIEEVACLV